jgi:hypothetical protein
VQTEEETEELEVAEVNPVLNLVVLVQYVLLYL